MSKDYSLSDQERKKARMQELNQETSKISWSDMQKFFASGSTIYVDMSLDLVETAAELSMDNKALLEQWMQAGLVAAVSDEQAMQWLEADTVVWAVVMAPYVLVQEIKRSDADHITH